MEEDKLKYSSYTQSVEFAAEVFVRACKEAGRKFYKDMNYKISREEFVIIETIHLNPGIIQFDISKKLFMQRSYVCKILIKLEEAGYIIKETATKGKRKTVIKLYLTENGIKIYDEIKSSIDAIVEKCPKERLQQSFKTMQYLEYLTEDLRKRYKLKL